MEARSLVPESEQELLIVERPAPPRRLRTVVVAAAGVALLALGCLALSLKQGLPAQSQGLKTGLTRLEEEDDDDENACDKYPYLKFEVPRSVLYRNLANKGPDHGNGEGMAYRTLDLGQGAGDELNREVLLTINATSDAYKPFSPRLNGIQGKYGSINLLSGSEVDLLFNFYDRETMEKLTMEEFAITFFDLDTGNGGSSTEYVKIGGFESKHVMGKTEVIESTEPDGRTMFKATTVGTGEDNPKDPNFLTAQQKNRAVTLLYGPTESISFTLGATKGVGPRFFTFVCRPSLLCATTVQENYRPPLPDITYEPPMEDGVNVGHKEKFVSFAVKVGDEVKKGDLIATTQKEGHPPKEYRAEHDGTVEKLQDKLKPGEELDVRLSDKVIAVIKRDEIPALPEDEDEKVVPGGPGEDAKLPAETVFKKWLVEPGDEVKKDDPIALVEKRKGHGDSEVKATDYGIVKERQEGLVPGETLIKQIPDENLITLEPLPALATDKDSKKAAEVPEELAEKDPVFEKYLVKKGDIVKAGDPIAVVKDKDGNEHEIKATTGGVISDLQDVEEGTPLDRIEDGNLATTGKFKPLPVGPGASPVGVNGAGTPAPFEEPEETTAAPEESEDGEKPEDGEEPGEEEKPVPEGPPGGSTPPPIGVDPPDEQEKIDPEGLKFVKYYVKPGDGVKTGDPIAQVEDKDGEKHDILAPKPGVVTHTQDGLQEGMVLDNVMQDENLATIKRLPPIPIDHGEEGSYAPEKENLMFKEWKVDEGDEVDKGDPIAVLTNPTTGEDVEVPASKTGIVNEKLKDLQPGDVVEESTTDDDLATIGLPKGPDIGLREAGVDVPSMDCIFVKWDCEMDERVHVGDPIADVECPTEGGDDEEAGDEKDEASGDEDAEKATERRLQAKRRRLGGFEKFTVPSPGTGWINYQADLKPGQKISEGAATPSIAKVNLGPPWWLVLLAALLALCCCFACLFKVMQKPAVYKPMPQPAPTPAPAPPPPAPKPEGLRLDFDDNGTVRTVYAKYKPLGIKHSNTAPIVVHDFTVNSYAKQELGVKPDWKLRRIGDEELNDSTDFEGVSEKLSRYMCRFPIWPLPLEFRKKVDDTETHVYKFVERPLGMEFTNSAPIKVEKVYEDSPAAAQNVDVGWYLTKIGEQPVADNQNFREVLKYFKEGVQGLYDDGKSYTIDKETMGANSPTDKTLQYRD